MASVHQDKNAALQTYIKLLANYGKSLPSTGGVGFKQSGVTVRSKLPNQAKIPTAHPSGRPPAAHIVHMLAQKMASTHYTSKAAPTTHTKAPMIHPGKALVLRNIKSIHLGGPKIKKVVL